MSEGDSREQGEDPGPGDESAGPDAQTCVVQPAEGQTGTEQAFSRPGSGETEFLPSSSSTSAGFDRARTLAREASRETGRLLKNRFVLEEEIGSGGMGVVYKARDLRKVEAEDSNPYIAAKVLGQDFKAHPDAFVTLQQETVKSQKLAHPNIVNVHDFDRDGDTVFMTMELLKGDPLDNLLRLEAPFSRETVLRYFTELCAGLDYAHRRGLIHSDLKPGNIFVTTGGTVKILDLGIARAVSRERQGHRFDAGDLGALTPAYATVEMVQGKPPSFSDDVYALACVVYEMLSGEHPYDNYSAAEARERKLQPARPPGLGNAEWQALSTALDVDSARRFDSIEAFRAAMLPQRRSYASVILAMLLLLVLAGAGWLGYDTWRNRAEQRAQIAASLQTAKDCFYRQDYACAEDSALVAANLAPENAEAAQLLQAAREAGQKHRAAQELQQRLQAASDCLQREDYDCAQVNAQDVLQRDSENVAAQQLLQQVRRARELAAVSGILARVEACLAEEDLDCAGRELASAEAAGARPADLYDTRRRVDELAARQRQLAIEREQAVENLLAAAFDCYRDQAYDCTEEKLAEVIALEPGNARAIELQQSVRMARELEARNRETVLGFLSEADACFARKNYSCAIARSESALAIIPGHAEATALRNRAMEAQARAKKNIVIE